MGKYNKTGKGIALGVIGPEALEKGQEVVDSIKEQSDKVVGTASDSAKTVIERAGGKATETIEKVAGKIVPEHSNDPDIHQHINHGDSMEHTDDSINHDDDGF